MIQLKECKVPEIEKELSPVPLTDETMQQRKLDVIQKMKEQALDALVIYADLEHGYNFEYVTGFLPRFEEALLILHQDGTAYMVMGNENLGKVKYARLKAIPVHMPHFSLPNQPMKTTKNVAEILKETNIHKVDSIGIVGWKYFTSLSEDNGALFDIPHFLVNALQDICQKASLKNATSIFIGENGVRTTSNANEIAHYHFTASLAGNCILEAMNYLELGMTEMQVAEKLSANGQHHNIVTIMAAGERFKNANLYPTDNTIKLGDRIAMTTGYKGGLQSRSGYAVNSSNELPIAERDYLTKVAIPYFSAIKTWIESVKIGIAGSAMYKTIEEVLPKETYGWTLNPGHLCGDEEWMSSPIYPNSKEILKSGMLFQLDIIPSVPGYAGASCESGIVLADNTLRQKIKDTYPHMWEKMQQRRAYMIEELGINIPEEVLPTSNVTAYYRPFLLHKKAVLTAK